MCNCIERVNEEMKTKNFNMRIDVPFTMSNIQRCCIEVEKVEPKGKKKVRLFASYCPFCGKDYSEETIAQDACPYCKGTGEEKISNINVRCRFCGGSGSVK